MIQFQSVALFAKGCHYSAGNKYNTLLSCMQTVDKHRQFCQTAISRPRISFTIYIKRGMSREFGGGQLKVSVAVRESYALRKRSPCALSSSAGLKSKQS